MPKRRRWTLVLVPHGAEPSRVVELSWGAVKLAGAAVVLCVVAAVLLGSVTVSRRVDLSRAARLEDENSHLAQELGVRVLDEKAFLALLAEGPEEELKRTSNTQPAILAVSVAVHRVLMKELGGRAAGSYEEALRWATNVNEFKLKVQGIATTSDLSRDQMAKTVVGAPEITRFGS